MSLPAPNLDNRTFQNIVDDVKRQVGLRCPEWTDHNVSDPGITLLELFAYMTEQMLFQLNQVPEKNHIRFLELLGVRLEMPRPAVTDLRYTLSRVIEDAPEAEGHAVAIPVDSVAATLRTETEDPIEFLTDRELTLARPRLKAAISIPAAFSDADANPSHPTVRTFDLEDQDQYEPIPALLSDEESKDPSFSVFSDERPGTGQRHKPQSGDRVCFAFEADVSCHTIDLVFRCATNRATGAIPDLPNQVWEFWDATERTWRTAEILSDTTGGFIRDGHVRIALPDGLEPRTLVGIHGFWVRCVYTFDEQRLPPRPARFGSRTAYEISPGIFGLRARTVGGTVGGTNCVRIYRETLGESDGRPGQRFRTRFAPVHTLGPADVILTASADEEIDSPNWIAWHAVPDFADSGPEDRHFVLDEFTGEVSFGPHIERPDGRPPDRHGATPEKGHQIVLSCYQVGGGTIGNVREGRVCIDKASIQYVAEVENPRPARNGRDIESMEHVFMKATKRLKVRNRAVTKEDYEAIALEKHGVGRACCLQPLHATAYTGEGVAAGSVQLLIVPALGHMPNPRIRDLEVAPEILQEVRAHLDERRLLTATLDVTEAKYVFVETEIRLIPDPRLDPDQIVARMRDRLSAFLHPLTGGPDGTGWPFGRTLTLTDLYLQLSERFGILQDVAVSYYRVGRPTEGRFGEPKKVEDWKEGLRLSPDETLCARQHNIRLFPMGAGNLRTEAHRR